MSDDLLSRIEPFVAKAQNEGADEIEIYSLDRSEKTVNFESSALKSSIAGITQGVGIRVLIKKSLGFAAVNSLEESKIESGIRDAISIAKLTPPMDHYYLPSGTKVSSVKGIYDDAVHALTMDDIVSYGDELLKTSLAIDPRISIDSGKFSSRIDESAIVTSSGIMASEKKSCLFWMVFGMAADGSDIGSEGYEYDSVVNVRDIDIQKCSQSFADKVLQNLGATKTNPFKGPALLSPEAALDLFYPLIIAAAATTIQSGQSQLQDKQGEEIAIKDLTITDNGSIPNSPASGSFDREGLPHQKLRIIDSGVFKDIYYNAFTAHKAELESTGHASGGFRSLPSVQTTNLEIHGGSKSFEDIISGIDKGVYIQRVSGSPDYISGDFSVVVKGGRLIENGALGITLKEITAVGNIFTAIKNISAISSEQKPLRRTIVGEGCWLVPYIQMENLDFVS